MKPNDETVEKMNSRRIIRAIRLKLDEKGISVSNDIVLDFIHAFREVIVETLISGQDFSYPGLFHFKRIITENHEYYDIRQRRWTVKPITLRIKAHLAENLVDIIKEDFYKKNDKKQKRKLG